MGMVKVHFLSFWYISRHWKDVKESAIQKPDLSVCREATSACMKLWGRKDRSFQKLSTESDFNGKVRRRGI